MKRLFLVPLLILATSSAAFGATYGFKNITNNNAVNAAAGEAQLFVDVTANGATQVDFKFYHVGTTAMSITDVYFDDGTLLGIASITPSGAGVNFSQAASPPELPGANNLTPAFQTTAGFSADSNPPTQPNGVNPGEWLIITFDLQSGKTITDVISALGLGGAEGGLRIGIHVQAFEGGGSESFVSPPDSVIPAPAAVALGMIGLGMLGWFKRRSA